MCIQPHSASHYTFPPDGAYLVYPVSVRRMSTHDNGLAVKATYCSLPFKLSFFGVGIIKLALYTMDKYKVIKFLNQGSFGKIYLVERRDCKQQFAMKTIKLSGIDRYQRLSILTEVRVLLTNDSEFLLKCYDLFVHQQKLCIITEYIDRG